MNLQLSKEQSILQRSARRFLESELPCSKVKELQQYEHTGHSKDLWQKLVHNGWLGVTIPEQYGGSGLSLLDLGLLYEEAGRALLPTTFYSTNFFLFLLSILGTEQQKEDYLPKIANGEIVGTVAFAEKHAVNNLELLEAYAAKQNEKWLLSGEKYFVPNASIANVMIVIARMANGLGNEGLAAFLIPSAKEGVSIEPMLTFGKDRQSVVKLSEVEIDSESILGGENAIINSEAGFHSALKYATALQCAEMAGGARKVVEITADYVSTRKQFGVPIGSFQAVQHHLANMSILADGAKLLSYQALSLLTEHEAAEKEVSYAKAFASEAYKSVTLLAHQLWGGIGYSTESDLYLWSNRAKATELSFGTRDTHLLKITDYL